MNKINMAFYWCSSCGGCEESILDLSEDLIEISEKVNIRLWPIAMDFKHEELISLSDNELHIAMINGAIRLNEHIEMTRLLREKAHIVIAHGACAHLGGVVGLGNLFTKADLLNGAYVDLPSVENPTKTLPFHGVEDTENKEYELTEMVMPLSHVIDVDYIIPGCPPPPELIQEVFEMILENNLPDTGFIFGDSRALCDSCPRKGTLSRDLKVKEFRRLYEIELDPSRCFLDQSLLCLGPITRGGCGARCIGSNMPCRGCFGPLDSVVDTGLRIISFLSSLIESDDKEDIEKAVASIPDPRGMFYFYGMASSIWSRSRKGESG